MTDEKFSPSSVGTGKDLKNFIDAENSNARKADCEARIRQSIDDIPVSSDDYAEREKQRNRQDNAHMFSGLIDVLGGSKSVTQNANDKPQRESFGSMMLGLIDDVLGNSAKPSRNEKPQLLSTKEAADILGVSSEALRNWRTRKLFGVPFFTPDEQRGGTWYYSRERIEQLKSVYQPGILQDMNKLTGLKRQNENTTATDFQIGVSSGEENFSESRENHQTNFRWAFQESDNTATPDFQIGVSSNRPNDSEDFQKSVSSDDKPVDEYHKQIAADLERAKRQMFDLPDFDNRGLSDDTRQRLRIYFLPKHRHPKFPNSSPSPRFIIKLGDDNDPPAYNAVLTPTGRRLFVDISPKQDKAAEKTLTAGEKLLFHPQALAAQTFFVTEGEINAASIMQATKWRVSACALGGAGIFGDLLRRLSALPNKPNIIILFDKDDDSQTGQTKSAKLQKLLADIGIFGLPIFLDDFLTPNQKDKLGDKKADPNEILQRFGDIALDALITKILDRTRDEFTHAAEKLQQLKTQATLSDAGADLIPLHMRQTSTASHQDSAQYDLFRAKIMLDKIEPADLDYYGWLAVISSCKNIGVDYSTVDEFNRRDSKRYDAGANKAAWDAVNDSSFDIQTLHGAAKRFGYKEADTLRQWFELHPELKPKNPHITGDPVIDQWQKINGVIHPDLLPELRAAADKINSLEHVTAAVANEISIQRRLGEFRYYSPFAAVDERFFARLRDAKSDAKKKILAWNKDNSQPEPTDADKALASLDIANINRKVEACLSQAKRAHQKYVNFSRRKEVTDQRNAERNAYITKPPTTKDEVPDCPVELILPEGSAFTAEGIFIIDTDKEPEKGGDHPVSACQNPVVPTKIFREPSKHITQYEIAIKNRNRWRRIVVDGRTIQDARFIAELGNFGAHISEPRMLAKFFAKIIALNENNDRLEEIRAFSQPGWHDEDFTNFAYPTGGDDYVVHRAGFDFKRSFASRGNPDVWKETFIDAMNQGGAIARIFVGTALAAPLIRPLHTSNAQIHLHGGINNGKTALAMLTASIFGNPKELFLTFESSIKNRLAVAAAFNDLPTFLEEMETRPSKEMEKALPQSVYSYFTGKANQANKRDGTPRDPFYFSGSRLSTGERPLLSDNDQTGAFKRIVQIRCKKLFTTKFSAPLYPFTQNNFGHFGHTWITFIAEKHNTISETFQMLVPKFTELALYEATQVNSVVAAAVAYQYFLICIGAQAEFDDFAARNDIVAILDELPTMQDISGSERLIRALRSFVDSHPKNFVTEYRDRDSLDAIREVEAASYTETFGKIFLNGEVAFYPTALKKIIEKELGFASSLAHIETFKDEDKLISTKDRPTQHKVPICGKYKWTIHFRAGILSEPGTDILEDDIAPPPQL